MIINISELLSATEKKEHYTVPLEKDDFRIQGRRYPIISKSPVEIDIINQGERKIMCGRQGQSCCRYSM